MPTVTLRSGKTFEVKMGESILDAAEKSGMTIPFSCKTGRCGVCKCMASGGNTHALFHEEGLNDEERDAGWILSCSRTADADVVLHVEDLTGLKIPSRKTLPCRISKIERLTTDIVRVFLRLPPKSTFDFLPGQHIDIIGPNAVRRSYSIANANVERLGIELHIRAYEGGVMTSYWFGQAKENDLLRLDGPVGTFFLRNLAGLNLVFLATGTGIAPVKSMLESLAGLPKEISPKTVSVIWGVRKFEDLYIDVSEICSGNINYVPVLSRPDPGWTGRSGYVQHVFLAGSPDLENTVVFACGSDTMIKSAKSNLLSSGLSSENFFSDAFLSSVPI
jgi:CDP-4-dehydro-6-deoxyglucose reductase